MKPQPPLIKGAEYLTVVIKKTLIEDCCSVTLVQYLLKLVGWEVQQ